MMRPLVVIAIPFYNGTRHLAPAIESVLVQTNTNIKLIIVDDASSEDPTPVIARFSSNAISYVRNAYRLGIVGNHNRCLDFNTGQYFKILSQDDELLPDSISSQVSLLESEPKAVFTSAPKQVVTADGRLLFCVDHGLRGLVSRTKICHRLAWSGTNICGEPASVLIRAEALRKTTGFSLERPWLLDIQMWLQLLEQGPALMSGSPSARFRISSQSYSVGMTDPQHVIFASLLTDLTEEGTIQPWEQHLGIWRSKLNAALRKWFYRRYGRS